MSLGGIVFGGFIGLVGFALIMYGRKEVRIPHIVVGVIFCAYPYFVGNWIAILVIAAFLIAGLVFVSRLGY